MRCLYSFVRVLIAKYHKLSSSINSSVSSYSSGGWKSKLECWWCCFLLRALRETVLVLSIVSGHLLVIIHVPWLLSYHFNPCLSLHMVFSLCVCVSTPKVPLLIRTLAILDLGPPYSSRTSSPLNLEWPCFQIRPQFGGIGGQNFNI